MRNLFLFFLLISSWVHAQDSTVYRSLPSPVGWVNDFENVFDEDDEAELTKIISDFEQASGNEIFVITTESLGNFKDLATYSKGLLLKWEVGKPEKTNGLIIVFSQHLREIRITTGVDAGKILTDDLCKEIAQKEMFPKFRVGYYYSGIKAGVLALIEKWKIE